MMRLRTYIRFDEWREERRQRRDIRRAVELFAQLEPGLADSLFDAHFLAGFEPDALLEMQPGELALAWTRQFRYSDERRRTVDIRWLTPRAEGFLDLLRRVMRAEADVATWQKVPRHGPTLAR